MGAWSIIQLYMFRLDLTMEKLSELAGIPYGTLNKRKQNPKDFKMYELVQIADSVEMTTEDWHMLSDHIRRTA